MKRAILFLLILLLGGFAARPTAARQRTKQAAGKTAEKIDLLVTGGTVVTMDAPRRVIDDGAIAIRGDSIVAVGPRAELEARFPHPMRRIDARGRVILPGLINGHTHAAMVLLRGIANDLNLQDWLEKYIFPAEARNVTEDFVTWGTRLAALEMIRGGTTTFVDMYYFEDAAARATKEAGMRGVLGESLIDFPVPDAKGPDEALVNIERFIKQWQGDGLIHPAVAIHSPYTCSGETLKKGAALARKYSAPILIHVSETKREREESLAKKGMTPVAYLDSLGFLGPDVVAAHCVWFDDKDIALAAQRGIGCVHNPSSNMMLASGTAPVVEMLRGGLRLGLGTDGPAGSNNDLNMMEEIDLAAKLQKVTRLDPRALSAEQALEMATTGGARALHMENEIGSLEPGKKADLILLRTDAPHAVPMYDVVSQVAYALKASDVETVIVGGRILMQDRRMLTLNEPEILAKAREYAEKVKRSLAPEKK
ncbi:MAG TPA: amidohydrolase [Candidatus Acidoferrum sp.]|nr:amidohydrolase [Candidatus Acidoferrum sp.]